MSRRGERVDQPSLLDSLEAEDVIEAVIAAGKAAGEASRRRMDAARAASFGGPEAHARTTDPDTSHTAAQLVNVTAQARQVLAVYVDQGDGLTADEAYRLAGLDALARQRCSDLLRRGYLERTGERRRTRQGRPAHVCRITQAGREWLAESG